MQCTQPYESWDLAISPFPARSRLYSLTPIGIGTLEVESLTGYVARLAEAHCVSVAHLVGIELSGEASAAPLIVRRSDRKTSHFFYTQPYAINGVGGSPKRWCAALQQATLRNDLSRLTLLAFESLLSRESLFRRRCAWCSSCLEERRRSGSAVYESLLWALDLVRICPIHLQFLEQICPRCGRTSGPLTTYSQPGYCSRCRAWLGRRGDRGSVKKTLSHADLEYELWVGRNVGELFAAGPQLEGVLLLERLRRNLCRYVEAASKGNLLAFGHMTGVSRSALRGWISGSHRPALRSILELCYRLRSPLVKLLQETVSVVDAGHLRDDRGVRSPHRADEVRSALNQALSDDSAPSVTQVARRLGYVSEGRIYEIDRECCKKIVARHRAASRIAHVKGRRANAPISPKDTIRKRLEDSLAQEHPVSVRQIARSLGYANAAPIRQGFPELCRAIGKKRALLERGRLRNAERILRAALKEDPPPSQQELVRRSGFSAYAVFRRNFREMYDAAIARRAAFRVEHREKMRAHLLEILRGDSAPKVLEVCREMGISGSRAYHWYPDLCRAIAAKRRQHERARLPERRALLRTEVFQIVSRLSARGEYPSRSRVQKILGGYFSSNWSRLIKQFLDEARQELNIPFARCQLEGIPR